MRLFTSLFSLIISLISILEARILNNDFDKANSADKVKYFTSKTAGKLKDPNSKTKNRLNQVTANFMPLLQLGNYSREILTFMGVSYNPKSPVKPTNFPSIISGTNDLQGVSNRINALQGAEAVITGSNDLAGLSNRITAIENTSISSADVNAAITSSLGDLAPLSNTNKTALANLAPSAASLNTLTANTTFLNTLAKGSILPAQFSVFSANGTNGSTGNNGGCGNSGNAASNIIITAGTAGNGGTGNIGSGGFGGNGGHIVIRAGNAGNGGDGISGTLANGNAFMGGGGFGGLPGNVTITGGSGGIPGNGINGGTAGGAALPGSANIGAGSQQGSFGVAPADSVNIAGGSGGVNISSSGGFSLLGQSFNEAQIGTLCNLISALTSHGTWNNNAVTITATGGGAGTAVTFNVN